jgi:hypothetical protein
MAFQLVPHEESFFDLFEKASHNLVGAARLLVDTMEHFDRLAENAKRLKQVEHDGDQIIHEIMARLHRTFITPLDREDIHQLATALDDVLDFIEETAEWFVIYRVKTPTSQARQMAGVIARQVEEIHAVLPHLRRVKQKDILSRCIEINRLENEADRLFREAVAELFHDHLEPLEVMKWRELYQLMERATDKSENVAVILEGIVLKND